MRVDKVGEFGGWKVFVDEGVKRGGGRNEGFGLEGGMMIKENHIGGWGWI